MKETSRIDIIGQNGNDGLHYGQEQEEVEKQYISKLIEDHWNYIYNVLDTAGCDEERLKEIGFHYRTAFAHGWKHHKEYTNGA